MSGPVRLRRPSRPSPADAAYDAMLATGAVLIAGVGALVGLELVVRAPRAVPFLLLAGGLGLFLIARPQWIVPTFVGVTWAALPGHVFGGLPSPVELGGLILLAFAVWRALKRPALAANVLLTMFLLAVPLLVASALSPLGSGFPGGDLRELLFLFIVALAVFGDGSAERVVVALVVVGLVLGLGGVFSVLVHPTGLFPVVSDTATAIEPEAPRAGGPFGEPNFYALSMAALTPLALYVASRGGWSRVLGIATLVAIGGAILAAGSRGGGVAMLFALVAFAAATPSRQLRLVALAAVLAVAALAPLFASQVGSSEGRSVEGRATENRIALAMAGDHPVVGVGPGHFKLLYREYTRKIGNDPRPTREPHSLPLQIAAEQGIVGLVGWLTATVVFLAYVLSRGIWRTRLGRALLLAVATYLVGSLFLHGSQLRLLFMLVGLSFAYATDLVERGKRADGAMGAP